MSRIQAVKGMNDVLPVDSFNWDYVFKCLSSCMKQFAYQEVRLPLIEQTTLFQRTIGDVTDIVEKEMYTFTDLNGDSISLRPEGTAGCVRAAIEHGLLRQTQKWWYFGPMFRHEKPQKGRYRQFHQLGAEIFGIADSSAELELLLLCDYMWKSLKISHKVFLELNCLGTVADRNNYKASLVDYFSKHADKLTPEENNRLLKNPLRLLDSKSEIIKQLLADAPKLIDYVSADAKSNFEQICKGLELLGISYAINPFLVRGLDYYSNLVFEWVTSELGSQATVCAGGRYDKLIEQLGGPSTSAVGFALGVERLILLLDEKPIEDVVDIFVLTQEDLPLVKTHKLANDIRQALGLKVEISLVPSSLKSQFKKADKSGAKYGLILGADELQNNQVTVKLLRGNSQEEKQLIVDRTDIIGWLREQHGDEVC